MVNPELRDALSSGVKEVIRNSQETLLHPISYARQLRGKYGTEKTIMWGVGLGTIALGVGSCTLAQSHPETLSYTFPALLGAAFVYGGLVNVFGRK